WVPPLPYPSDYNALQDVIAHLRSPDGCPWDREQTHESLRPYLLEETYEVLEAIDQEDAAKLAEELGDLLIQIALHVQIATEEGEFKMGEVIARVVEKLVRRHPHVFGDVDVADAAEVARNWEVIKAAERAKNKEDKATAEKSMLDGIPRALPALALVQTYVERLARVGYPAATAAAGLDEDALGRALLTLVEQAQSAGLDAESALRRQARLLRERLQTVERLAAERGHRLTELDQAQQRALWTKD
ncbi:MAG: MazG family protein, partial [Chloroflexi bacterium]|nr:MazG family protein [Chloroflexota bacterium]